MERRRWPPSHPLNYESPATPSVLATPPGQDPTLGFICAGLDTVALIFGRCFGHPAIGLVEFFFILAIFVGGVAIIRPSTRTWVAWVCLCVAVAFVALIELTPKMTA